MHHVVLVLNFAVIAFVLTSGLGAEIPVSDAMSCIQTRSGVLAPDSHHVSLSKFGSVHALRRNSVNVSLAEIERIQATFANSADSLSQTVNASNASTVNAKNASGMCFDGVAWLDKFAKEPIRWNAANDSAKHHSQGNQDAVLWSLFSDEHLGTTNKAFVEFGFPDDDLSTSYGNGHALQENLGFSPALLLDGAKSNPKVNLHKRFVTGANIVGLFDQFKVPLEADYVSVDVDSCDLWLFWAITEKYRPRVMTVEYNINYNIEDYSTLKCDKPKAKNSYYWKGDNAYGASLSAIELAAQTRGYSLVYVTPYLDAFLVRSDLLCNRSAISKTRFQEATGISFHNEYTGEFGPKSELVLDFKQWLEDNM